MGTTDVRRDVAPIDPRSHPCRPEVREQKGRERIHVRPKHGCEGSSPDHLQGHRREAGHEQDRRDQRVFVAACPNRVRSRWRAARQ